MLIQYINHKMRSECGLAHTVTASQSVSLILPAPLVKKSYFELAVVRCCKWVPAPGIQTDSTSTCTLKL